MQKMGSQTIVNELLSRSYFFADDRKMPKFRANKPKTQVNSVERALYAEIAKGRTSASCKNPFLKKYCITARQFNACRVNIEGKIAACKAGQEQAIANLKQQITSLDKKVRDLEKKPSKHLVLHHKKRRLINLSHRVACLEEDRKKGRVHLCFGGKKLFRAQFHLEKSGFASQQEWQDCWKAKRSSEFFVLGSKDETAGNQTCSACKERQFMFTTALANRFRRNIWQISGN